MSEITVLTRTEVEVKYLIVEAEVRYWEDAEVNGVEDEDGALIPCRNGDSWNPTIRLDDGQIIDWPSGTTAEIHYKVCDAGQYFLAKDDRKKFLQWKGDYVPNDLLCIGDNGYGDYIILSVGEDGKIKGWTEPKLEANQWEAA
ncbi:hypothetical protein [Chitinibacter tainanensis]|uniref:hypothetical protein n=1 Tax=Chitinibacter tainanensis TaxID=230667 RepID=UPI00235637A5|nr:hypothetical protein [Chitinibacter tainanensis]